MFLHDKICSMYIQGMSARCTSDWEVDSRMRLAIVPLQKTLKREALQGTGEVSAGFCS